MLKFDASGARDVHRARALECVVALSAVLAGASDARASDSSEGQGLVVVAEGSSASPSWSLAHAVYGDPSLRPPALDEAHARVLVGEPPASDAPRELRDLAELRAAVHGDDATSRSLLNSVAASLHAKGLLVVRASDGVKPVARAFLAGTHAFDPVVYESDSLAVVTWGAEDPVADWARALTALHRAFAEPARVPPAIHPALPIATLQPAAVPIEGEKGGPAGKPFYTSPWFWGALGAAAFAGAAFFFVSRGASDPTIQLQVQVPK